MLHFLQKFMYQFRCQQIKLHHTVQRCVVWFSVDRKPSFSGGFQHSSVRQQFHINTGDPEFLLERIRTYAHLLTGICKAFYTDGFHEKFGDLVFTPKIADWNVMFLCQLDQSVFGDYPFAVGDPVQNDFYLPNLQVPALCPANIPKKQFRTYSEQLYGGFCGEDICRAKHREYGVILAFSSTDSLEIR